MENEVCIITEFISILGNNIKSIKYTPLNDEWTINYKNDLQEDVVKSEDLRDFLHSA